MKGPIVLLLALAVLASGVLGCRPGPTLTPTPMPIPTPTLIPTPIPTPTAIPTTIPEPVTWDIYATPISVLESDISKIAIDYSWGGLTGELKRSYVLEKVNAGFQTDQGGNVDEGKVDGLGSSLVNLRRSGGLKSCINHTDDYPYFRIEIAYENGSKAILYSGSNCADNIPWNVVYDDKLYVQYTGEIPTALYDLLSSFVDDFEDWRPVAGSFIWGGSSFPIIGYELPDEVKGADFSERELYLQALIESDLFNPFLSQFEVSDLQLYCSLHAGNRDCSEIDGIVTLNSIDGEIIYSTSVKYAGQEVIELVTSMGEAQEINERVRGHTLVRRIRALKPDTAVMISCTQQPGCNEWAMYNEIYSGLGLSTPSECSLCSIRFDKWEVYHEFIYFPEIERMWVDHLHYWPRAFQENRNVLDLGSLLEFYRAPGYETFVDDHIIGFEIQKCHRIMVYYEQEALEQNPDYISVLNGENSRNYGNRIDVYGYCIFVNDQGELEALRKVRN